ncbi:MAG TPA: hypothetical protein VMU04_00620 [Candidatus Acidoferrum sp.]|nr:hypothetical protein [Candidatus Acidoferrum sp.]
MAERIQEALRFRPWPQGDPVAPWVIDHLSEVQLARVAAIELELTKAILDAQVKAASQLGEVIKGMGKQ